MATETEIKPGGEAKPDPKPPEGKPPEAKPDPKPPEVKAPSAPDTKPEVGAKGGEGKPGPKRAVLAADDDELPADAELLELSPRALKSRLDRHTKKELKGRFGTDDVEAIGERLAKLEKMEAAEEEARKAALTEQDRLKEQLASSEREKEGLKARHQRYRDRQQHAQVDRHVVGIMSKHIAPKFVGRWVSDLKQHVQGFDEGELRDADALIEKWCKEQVDETPQIGVAFKATDDVEPKPRVPITTGPDVSKPGHKDPSGGPHEKKTAAPGRPNSMTTAEYREYLRENNIQY